MLVCAHTHTSLFLHALQISLSRCAPVREDEEQSCDGCRAIKQHSQQQATHTLSHTQEKRQADKEWRRASLFCAHTHTHSLSYLSSYTFIIQQSTGNHLKSADSSPPALSPSLSTSLPPSSSSPSLPAELSPLLSSCCFLEAVLF